ncbi:protein asteroid-like [Bombus pascuorum]|uniref:protein asteroid-like n=1 Tax=Bombus pascuorum TaxID=65598 RepID=UPI00298EC087|nr:protein asteroid-like [Bombus pascuorum]
MGIRGLTAYINQHKFNFLEHYKLRDTYLVIDGNNIYYSLYTKCTCDNWTFGGDYDNYAQCISDFFDDLLKCNITPLVFIDGSVESKKFKTIVRRMKNKLDELPVSVFRNSCPQKLFPLLRQQVFIDVMKEKNIRYVQCLFEADNTIASVAKILNCPVLSCDSDFYIYGSLYIPFNTFQNDVIKNSDGDGYIKFCKIYKVEKLFKHFTGLDQSKLILAAILLGNDYVEPGTFRNFFRYLKLKPSDANNYSRQYRISGTLSWLSKYSLHDAIIEILSRLTMPMRQKILDLIEMSINDRRNECAETLESLGFPKDYITRINTYRFNRSFKFDGNINTLTYIEEVWEEGNDELTEEDKEEDYEIEIAKIFTESELMSNTATISNLPIWFVNEFRIGKYPSYFLDLIIQRLYVCPIQVEDFRYPSNIIVSLKILSIIVGILKLMIDNNINCIRYLMRTEDKKIMCYKLKAIDITNTFRLPFSFNLSNVSLLIQRKILNNTLGITDMDCINELPPKWILYVGCIKYWIHQQECPISYKCYLYSIFICMLFDIIDFKIGKYRSINIFNKKYKQTIEAIKQKRKESNYNPCCVINGTIREAYNEIVHDDCVLAAPFFISHFEVDETLYNTDKFDIHIVHVFGEFQSCLKHIMDLNTLLGCPYPQPKVAHLYNGTLLYNLCNNFRTHHNMEEYINIVLQMSPSLLRFFNTFLLKVKPMFPFKF